MWWARPKTAKSSTWTDLNTELTSSRLNSSTSASNRLPVIASIVKNTEVDSSTWETPISNNICESRSLSPLKMGYPCQVFHASELPERVQTNLSGRKRKLDQGEKNVDLNGCELLEMLQYKCEIKEPVKWDSPVQCFAVERLFRKWVFPSATFSVLSWKNKVKK